MAERIKLVDALILHRAASDKCSRLEICLIKTWWALRGGSPERQLGLRWLPARYRLMVADSDAGPWGERIRELDGKRIPIFTRREGERRKAEFLEWHSECVAKLERVAGGKRGQ